MKNLNDLELMNIEGGAVNVGLVVGIAAGITFLIGLIDGQIKLK